MYAVSSALRSLYMNRNLFVLALAFSFLPLCAAPRDRITQPIDPARLHRITGNLHQSADPKFDRGAVDPSMPMNDVLIMFKLSPGQQSELDRLLADQQTPSSKQFHKWLTPEEFGNRFGLSRSDQSKVTAWLTS